MIDSGKEVIAMTRANGAVIDLKVYFTTVKDQKINSFFLNACDIVIVSLEVSNKQDKALFFWEMFPLTDISMQIVFEISLLTVSIADI